MTPPLDFALLFERAPNPYMVLDRNLRYVAANEAYLTVTGATWETLQGRSLFEAFPGDPDQMEDPNVRLLRASLERVLVLGVRDELAIIPYTMPRQTPEGIVHEERFWSATHTPILGPDGEVAFILQHTVDVTELQQTKAALEAAEAALDAGSEQVRAEAGVFRRAQAVQETNRILDAERQRLHLLFQQAPSFMAVLSGPEHVFELTNRAYNQLVGDRALLGKPIRTALPEVTDQGFIELLDDVYQTGQPYIGHSTGVMLERQPGAPLEMRYVDFIYQPLVDEQGQAIGIFVQGHDVTEQVEAQQSLRQVNSTLEARVAQRTAELARSNRELQEFAYVASHDLQEPLRKIQAFSSLLLQEPSESDEYDGHHYLERIQAAAARMSALIRDLLAFSRITTRSRPPTPVNLDDTLAAVLSDLEIRLKESKGQVDADPLGTVTADPVQMHQVLLNLVANALKFQQPGQPPRVRVWREDDDTATHLIVEDHGIGFDPKYAERIFAPFQRLHGTSAYEGTGMGLAIVRRIAERHGGHVTAESTPEQGSRFTLTLPHTPPQEAPPAP